MTEKLSLDSEIFTRAVDTIITSKELEERLRSGKPLRIKHGIDATSDKLHIGHAASLWKLRALQEAGHKAVILFGDITTLIGDPTGKSKTRPALDQKTIKKNITALTAQVKKILLSKPSLLEIHKSSEWYGNMKMPECIGLLGLVTHARLIERDMFQERMNKGSEIFMHELIYPILQGYDSVMLKSDLTIMGSDQLFNEHMGRFMQEKFGQRPQSIVALSILEGIGGGEKMSKSLGNFIGLTDAPEHKFGKIMSIPDRLIVPYFESYTNVPLSLIRSYEADMKKGGNPMEVKLLLAEAVVRRYHGNSIAQKARNRFLAVFSKKDLGTIPERALEEGSYTALRLLVHLGLINSNSEGRRLLHEGAIEINGNVIRDSKQTVEIRSGDTIRVGKKTFVRIK